MADDRRPVGRAAGAADQTGWPGAGSQVLGEAQPQREIRPPQVVALPLREAAPPQQAPAEEEEEDEEEVLRRRAAARARCALPVVVTVCRTHV